MIEVKHATRLPDNWIAKTVSDWSGVLLLNNCSHTDALRRLKIANGSTPHKLYLILDGIDETDGDQKNRIRQLFEVVYKSPTNVALIVTCRDKSWFVDLLEPMGKFVKDELDNFLVLVDYFNRDELSELVSELNPSAAKEKFMRVVRPGFNAFGKDAISLQMLSPMHPRLMNGSLSCFRHCVTLYFGIFLDRCKVRIKKACSAMYQGGTALKHWLRGTSSILSASTRSGKFTKST